MTDRNDFDEYDEYITEELSELPLSDKIVSQTTPWKTAINQITFGLVLTNFTINFHCLQYILPWIGTMLIYLGFRTLRRDNWWFRACWILSVIRILDSLFNCVLLTTKLSQVQWLSTASIVAGVLLVLILLFTFRMALRHAFAQVNEKPYGDPLLGAIVWNIAGIVLALSSPLSHSQFALPHNLLTLSHSLLTLSHSLITFISLIFFYIIIIYLLHKAGKNLDQWGYQVQAAPVRIGRNLFCILYVILMLLLLVTGSVISSRVPMEAYKVDVSTVTNQQSVRDHLVALGFPEEILADISDEELEGMGSAIRCSAESQNAYFGGKTVTVTTASAELPERKLRTVIYFKWDSAPAIYWQDAIQAIGFYTTQSQISGRILYDKDGTSYAAPLSGLYAGTGQSTDYSLNGSYEQIFARLSFPLHSSKQRGYVMYSRAFGLTQTYVGTSLYYYHQTGPIILPYTNVTEEFINGKYDSQPANIREFNTEYETVYKIEKYGSHG